MKNIEFLSYIDTPEEKYMGIATVIYDDAIVLRYRVQMAKDGIGFYVSPPAFKDAANDEWLEWHSIDSRSKSTAINAMIKTHVQEFIDSKKNSSLKKEVSKLPQENPWGPPSDLAF